MTTGPAQNEIATLAPAADARAQSSVIEQLLVRFGEVARRAGTAHGLHGVEIDEVLQEVRIRIWHAGAARDKLESLTSSYIYRTAVSAAVDMLRRRRARQEQRLNDDATAEPVDVPVPSREQPDQRMIGEETQREIETALETLVASRRAVVRMYLKGYSREEIAALLGWSEAKTRNLLYRGLDDLRHRLIAKGIHP